MLVAVYCLSIKSFRILEFVSYFSFKNFQPHIKSLALENISVFVTSMYDVNGNGYIDLNEMTQIVRSITN